jgi:hypothetical protein
MYSRLNVLVNEINALGVKDITDLNMNCKILQSLWKPDSTRNLSFYDKIHCDEVKFGHIM